MAPAAISTPHGPGYEWDLGQLGPQARRSRRQRAYVAHQCGGSRCETPARTPRDKHLMHERAITEAKDDDRWPGARASERGRTPAPSS